MSNDQEKSIKSLCIYLLKEGRDSFKEYIKGKYSVASSKLKSAYGLDGEIFYPSTNSSSPRWKQDVQDLAASTIEIEDNSSNKAVLIAQIDDAIVAITYGYGRSLIKDEDIVRNFGLKVALSIIDPKKIRSVNTATFEDMVVSTQHQASTHTSQDEFDLDTVGNIFRGVTGVPNDETYGRSVTGKDMLKVSVFMHISELKEKLKAYLAAYRSEKYKQNDFEWIDNINEVRDGVLAEGLDGVLIEKLEKRLIADVAISPPETIDWDSISGIFIRGVGKALATPAQSIDVAQYLENAKGISIAKLKRDRLQVRNDGGDDYVASNIYNALVTQVDYEGKKYILCMGSWYLIQNDFYQKVSTYIDAINRDDNLLPACSCKKEGDYNEITASANADLCLMDKRLFKVEDAPSGIEACDLFSSDKKFIHVKFKTRSSMLSHLFAQGRVSYQSFVSDPKYRQEVIEEINSRFGRDVLSAADEIEGYEVVYAIVTPHKGKLSEIIPFFSAVTLMQTAKALASLRVKFSVCIVDQK